MYLLALLGMLAFSYATPSIFKATLLDDGSINIEIPDVVSGNQIAGLYANRNDIGQYSIFLDGNTIATGSAPSHHSNGSINASYCYVTRGIFQSGNITALNNPDGNTIRLKSKHYHPWDQLTFNVEFSENTFASLKPFSLLELQGVMNASRSVTSTISLLKGDSYVTLASLPLMQIPSSFQRAILNQTASTPSLIYRFKVEIRSNSAFFLDLDAFHLAFVSNASTPSSMSLFTSIDIDTTTLLDGIHVLRAEATTISGMTLLSQKNFIVDNTAPSIIDVIITPFDANDSHPVSITARFVDANLEASSCEYEAFGNTILIDYGANELLNYTNLFPNGSIQLLIRTEDKAGNARAETVEFNVTHVVTYITINNTIVEPSATIAYPPALYPGISSNVTITSNNTSQVIVREIYNGSMVATSSFPGNSSIALPIRDSREGTSIVIEIDLLDSEGLIYMTQSVNMSFVKAPESPFLVVIDFESISSSNSIAFTCNMSIPCNVSIYYLGELASSFMNVTSFVFQSNLQGNGNHSFLVVMDIDGHEVFIRHVNIEVAKEDIDRSAETFLWVVVVIMGVSILTLVISRQRNKL